MVLLVIACVMVGFFLGAAISYKLGVADGEEYAAKCFAKRNRKKRHANDL